VTCPYHARALERVLRDLIAKAPRLVDEELGRIVSNHWMLEVLGDAKLPIPEDLQLQMQDGGLPVQSSEPAHPLHAQLQAMPPSRQRVLQQLDRRSLGDDRRVDRT